MSWTVHTLSIFKSSELTLNVLYEIYRDFNARIKRLARSPAKPIPITARYSSEKGMLLEIRPITIKLDNPQLIALIIVKFNNLREALKLLPSRVKKQTIINKLAAKPPLTTGESTQLIAVWPTFHQLRSSYYWLPASPAPIKAPTSLWVVDIGIPKSEAAKIKMKDATLVPNIIRSCVGIG